MPAKTSPLGDRIVEDPAILLGKPAVRGTRIPVELVLEHLPYNPDRDDLFAAYPCLALEDVNACLAFASSSVRRAARRTVRANLDAATRRRE